MSNTDHILFTEQGSYRDYFEAFLRKCGIATEAGMEFWSIEAIQQCVICGLGISLLPLISVQSELQDRRVASLPWDRELGTVATIMAYHQHKWISPVVKQFLQTVREHAQIWKDEESICVETSV